MALTIIGDGGLFTVLGKSFHAQREYYRCFDELRAASDALLPEHNKISPQNKDTAEVLDTTHVNAQSFLEQTGFVDPHQSYCEGLVIQQVNAEAELQDLQFNTARLELTFQLWGTGTEENPQWTVKGNTVGASVTPEAGNTGQVELFAYVDRGARGRRLENVIPERLRALAFEDQTSSITLYGDAATPNRLSPLWPAGGAVNTVLPILSVGDSGLANAGFETDTARAGFPDSWDLVSGTTANVALTEPEIQTVAISGTPTSGFYVLRYTDAGANVWQTSQLAHDATGGQVGAALRAIPDLSGVTVETSGTSPNLTHTITFNGLAGNITQLTSTNDFDTGSIAHATTREGEAGAYRARSLKILADGSNVVSLRQTVNLTPITVYHFSAKMKLSSYATAGSWKFSLANDAGEVLDTQGGANNITVDLTSGGPLSTSEFRTVQGWFCTPNRMPEVCTLTMGMTGAVDNLVEIYLDELILTAGSQVYQGGPYVSAVGGLTPIGEKDSWILDITNDRGGKFQEAWLRNFGDPDYTLPSVFDGSETIPDTLVS